MASCLRGLDIPSDLCWTLRRCYIDAFLDQQVAAWSASQLVLDLGGSKVDKRGRFDLDRFSHRAVYVNLVPEKKPDVQADAHSLPFADAVFDTIICAEVLEHVFRPDQVMREINRVLKEGGALLITVPFLTPIHADPDDFARFTDTFWQQSLEEIGFTEVTVIRQGLFWSVLLDMLRDFLVRGGRKDGGFGARALRLVLKKAVIWGRRRVVAAEHAAEADRRLFLERFTTGFGIVARKPSGHLADEIR